ncbi:hypothetical protein C8R44DRAFT_819435, partial [Mycena epipterygia]
DSTQDIASAVEEVAKEQRLDHQRLKHAAVENGRAHDQLMAPLDISKSVRDVARKQEWYHEFAKRDRIIEWYSPLNFFPRQADIFNSRQPGTGEWLLEHDLFNEWKLGTNNPSDMWCKPKTIWCRGMPGAGKTVLVCVHTYLIFSRLR